MYSVIVKGLSKRRVKLLLRPPVAPSAIGLVLGHLLGNRQDWSTHCG